MKLVTASSFFRSRFCILNLVADCFRKNTVRKFIKATGLLSFIGYKYVTWTHRILSKVDKTRRLWGGISIQDHLLCSWVITNFELNLAPSLLNFVRQAVPVPVVFLNYYKPGLLFADLGDAKTVVRWTRNHIGLLLSISWRCWVYLPVPSPRFLQFGRVRGNIAKTVYHGHSALPKHL